MIQTGHWGDPPIPPAGWAEKHGKAKKRAARKRRLSGLISLDVWSES